MSNLFNPITVGRVQLENRIVLPPLTRLRAINGIPGEEVVEYYRQRAAASAGTLLIGEATFTDPRGSSGMFANVPGLYNDEQVAAWKKVTDAVHKHKSFIYAQIVAIGRAGMGEDLVGPSAIAAEGGKVPRALTTAETKEYVKIFEQAAKNAIAAGFDGVEIHGANGFLIDEFLRSSSNERTDEYGGSIDNRARFALEVVDVVSAAIGADRTSIRISPWYSSDGASPIPVFAYLVEQLESRAQNGKRLAYIHAIEPRTNIFVDELPEVPHHLNNFIRDIWQGIFIRSGSFGRSTDEIKELAAKDDKLLIAIGRLFISNPDLVEKLRAGTPLDPYDRATFYWDGSFDIAKGYTRDFVKVEA